MKNNPPLAGTSRPAGDVGGAGGATGPSLAELEVMIRLPPDRENQRAATARSVAGALDIVRAFAARHGWEALTREPFFHQVEIFAVQQQLWARILELNEVKQPIPMPSDAVTAALEKGVLLALVREEAERLRPEYFSSELDWTRTLAHEIVHRLHVRILHGNEDAMGPPWFFEGLAVYGSGQPLGGDLHVESADQALALAHQDGRGAYARYAAAIRFFAERIPLPELVSRAGAADFESWLRSRSAAPAR